MKDRYGRPRDPDILRLLDTACHHKGMSVTAAAINLPHGTVHPQAPSNTHEHGYPEGGDGNTEMKTEGKLTRARRHEGVCAY